MKLRTRLALIVLATTLPVVAGIAWARARFEHQTLEQSMSDFVLARMENGGREQCEASPETFPEPPWRRGGPREREERREYFERMFGAPERGPGADRPPPGERELDPERSSSRDAAPRDRPRPGDRPLGREEVQPEEGSPPPGETSDPAGSAGDRDAPRATSSQEAPGPGRTGGPERPGAAERRPRDERPGPRPPEGQRGGRGFDPRRLGGAVPPRIELWAYDASYVSRNPRAPAFPAELKVAVEHERGHGLVAWEFTNNEEAKERGLQFAMRTPWEDGPCAIMLARRQDQGPQSAVAGLLWSSLALCAVLLAAVLFSAGPVVARVRELTTQVKDSAAGRYSTTVDERGKDEISELARAFNAAGSEVRTNLEALEKRERTLRTFVENTSHDVMLPLTVLQGHLDTLRKRVQAGILPDKETVRDALEESHYLSSLLQNLSVAAKLEGGEPLMARHPVDLNALVERAVSRQRPIARQRNILVDFAVPEATVWIVGDVTFVEQMVSNVIHNAVRYNHDGGHVAVLLEERGEGCMEFSLRVLDDGPGIPEELCDQVVERSFRTDDARTRAPDGLGLGLSIAKDVARRHDLTMAMRRSPAGGLEVEFAGLRTRLEDVSAPETAERASPSPGAGSSSSEPTSNS